MPQCPRSSPKRCWPGAVRIRTPEIGLVFLHRSVNVAAFFRLSSRRLIAPVSTRAQPAKPIHYISPMGSSFTRRGRSCLCLLDRRPLEIRFRGRARLGCRALRASLTKPSCYRARRGTFVSAVRCRSLAQDHTEPLAGGSRSRVPPWLGGAMLTLLRLPSLTGLAVAVGPAPPHGAPAAAV
jgi:hypothetical protein